MNIVELERILWATTNKLRTNICSGLHLKPLRTGLTANENFQ